MFFVLFVWVLVKTADVGYELYSVTGLTGLAVGQDQGIRYNTLLLESKSKRD